jgi:transposase-like protein
MGGFRRKFTDEQRRNALALYGEHGAAEAARRLPFEVSAPTLRQWAKRAGLTGPRAVRTKAATNAARLNREERAEQLAADALDAAAEFLSRAREANPSNARLLMAAFSEALRGSQLLAGDPTDRLEIADLEREIEHELQALIAAKQRNADQAINDAVES